MSDSPASLNRARVVDSLILAAIVGLGLWMVLGKETSGLQGLVGQRAPQFKLRTVSGEVTGTPDHTGKVMLLDFWATWCQPCFRQMPIIKEVLAERTDVVLIPINVDDPGAKRDKAMADFLGRAGLDVDALLDDGTVQMMYRVDTIPALVLIGPDGKIAYASSGVHTAKELRDRIDHVGANR